MESETSESTKKVESRKQKVGPLNLSQVSEGALVRLLKSTCEGGVFPPGTTKEERRLLGEMKDYLVYRTRARNRSDPKAYEHERNELIKYAWEIALLKAAQCDYPVDVMNLRRDRQRQFFSEAMDVLATVTLGARHTWLERELAGVKDYINMFMAEVKTLKGAA